MSLDEANYRNLCAFYREELRRLQEGEPTKDLFNRNERRCLREKGVIIYELTRKNTGRWRLSQKTLSTLLELEEGPPHA